MADFRRIQTRNQRNENDGKTTAVKITVDFFKESIAIFEEVKKKIYQT